MIQNLIVSKMEDVERSREIVASLAAAGITAEKRNELLAELERICGPIRRTIIQEVLNDLNNLGPLLRGTLLKTFAEPYTVEVDDLQRKQRYGWELMIIDGKKFLFDPAKDPEERKFEPVRKMQIEKSRMIHVCETNRAAVARIAELLREFLEKLKGELCRADIGRIIDEKRAVESAIAQVDRREMKKENFGEADFQDADYIKKPARYNPNPLDQQSDLFRRFDEMKQGVVQ